MAKFKTTFFCQNCGAQSPKWMGKCNSCGSWNTYVEEVVQVQKEKSAGQLGLSHFQPVQQISEISSRTEARYDTKNMELNRVLGGGLVPGSLVLIGGEPGIGKSTLVLQVALQLTEYKVLYISGEESPSQLKLRANRIPYQNSGCYVLSETNLEKIVKQLEIEKPDVLIIDSIQTLQTERVESTPGSISQIRECTMILLKIAKENNLPIFLIGHINKDGNIAGPKVLEHIVDTVLQFEGDSNYLYRILRATKNRFGSTSEIGIYEMQATGLREVSNPSELLLTHHNENYSGISISATMEGNRPLLIEVQALVSSAVYGVPQRSSTGFDLRRMSMLLAVLEKRAGFRLGAKDVFLNIAGGIKVNDPAIDLSVICSVLSSDQDIYIPSDTCFAGEVGLSGEIRPVSRIDQRIGEAAKIGFKRMFISKHNSKSLVVPENIKIRPISGIEELFRELFG
jgi:DNA repair protein RadA/Sms